MTQDMLDAANRLSEALLRENTALAALDLMQAVALLEEKTGAVERFAAAARLADAPLVDRRTTLQAAHRLRDLADENRRLLEHAIKVQSRVVGCIRQAANRPGVDRRYRRGGKPETALAAPVTMLADV